MTDFQTVQLGAGDRGWTTRGAPEGRAGGPRTYDAPHLRYRDYYADMRVTVALRLEPAEDAPTLDDLADALQEPARPLFIGRKPCLPSAPLFGDFEGADSALAALLQRPLCSEREDQQPVRTQWPQSEGVDSVDDYHVSMLTDQRNWRSGLHGGGKWVCTGAIDRSKFPPHARG